MNPGRTAVYLALAAGTVPACADPDSALCLAVDALADAFRERGAVEQRLNPEPLPAEMTASAAVLAGADADDAANMLRLLSTARRSAAASRRTAGLRLTRSWSEGE